MQVGRAATGVTVTPTITPNSGLTNGESVTLTASGLAKNSIGNILECNDDAKQPNVMVGGVVNSPIAVSCIAPSLSALVTVSASGDVSGTFKVVQGTVGPPCGPAPAAATCPATDSAGNSPTADAALYPCPPTPAQQAIGDVCTLTYGDEANDSAVGNILFAGESAPSATTTTGAAPAATTTTTKPPVTAATVAPATGATGGTTVTTPVSAAPAPTGTLATDGSGARRRVARPARRRASPFGSAPPHGAPERPPTRHGRPCRRTRDPSGADAGRRRSFEVHHSAVNGRGLEVARAAGRGAASRRRAGAGSRRVAPRGVGVHANRGVAPRSVIPGP